MSTATQSQNESAVLDGVPKQLYIGGDWTDPADEQLGRDRLDGGLLV